LAEKKIKDGAGRGAVHNQEKGHWGQRQEVQKKTSTPIKGFCGGTGEGGGRLVGRGKEIGKDVFLVLSRGGEMEVKGEKEGNFSNGLGGLIGEKGTKLKTSS